MSILGATKIDYNEETPEPPCTNVVPETCPDEKVVHLPGCQDVMEVDLGDIELLSQGRIAEFDVRVKNVCPHKRVALAIVVHETDEHENEYPRGLKTLTLPANNGDKCCDIIVRCVKFILPEDLDVSGTADAMCNQRNLKVRVFANYIDTDFVCCHVE